MKEGGRRSKISSLLLFLLLPPTRSVLGGGLSTDADFAKRNRLYIQCVRVLDFHSVVYCFFGLHLVNPILLIRPTVATCTLLLPFLPPSLLDS